LPRDFGAAQYAELFFVKVSIYKAHSLQIGDC
jgi:hypothetical protein